jgi:hypothetical protein
MSKQILVKPDSRFDYLVDGFGQAFLIDNDLKHVSNTGFTKRKLTKNKIHYFWSNKSVSEYFNDNGKDIFNVDSNSTGIIGFDFKDHVYSNQKVICDICNKFTVSADNEAEMKKHTVGHYFYVDGIVNYKDHWRNV